MKEHAGGAARSVEVTGGLTPDLSVREERNGDGAQAAGCHNSSRPSSIHVAWVTGPTERSSRFRRACTARPLMPPAWRDDTATAPTAHGGRCQDAAFSSSPLGRDHRTRARSEPLAEVMGHIPLPSHGGATARPEPRRASSSRPSRLAAEAGVRPGEAGRQLGRRAPRHADAQHVEQTFSEGHPGKAGQPIGVSG